MNRLDMITEQQKKIKKVYLTYKRFITNRTYKICDKAHAVINGCIIVSYI